ncbi:DUF2332 family protein [Pseudenhygromyxa sp. WMMC2535]|uniref:DUF2332 family protein n=1 Tax=Pseudenhygromyxa sp. WMMC2535 TaxID=2712867 RepID=UPI00155680B1|nr:DUF2332 family protein [Pseudenhygromyxa sp. WMMC2535]
MPARPAWSRHRQNLAVQASMVRGYSQLTAAMLNQAVQWFSDPDAAGRELGGVEAVMEVCDRIAALLDADQADGGETGWINDLDPALRLNAALHWYVLTNDPRVAELRPYYKTVPEGEGPEARDPRDEEFGHHLLRAVSALGGDLFERAANWRAISNETSRGLAWLLPAVMLEVEAAHLIEFGCNAGLNLYAEQRRYDLAWGARERLRLGRAKRDQFLILCSGPKPDFASFSEETCSGPEILSRVGGDPEPFDPEVPGAEERLEASVWGDHRRRLDRLREAVDIHERAREAKIAKAELRGLDFPAEVTDFLTRAVPATPEAPVISYNTYVTAYLSDVHQRAAARDIRAFARNWSLRHKLPWMWVRFEPARPGQHVAPHAGWCRWVVELFNGSWSKKVELGWTHPYLVRAEFGPGLLELRAMLEDQS